jgi:hypothetical protein
VSAHLVSVLSFSSLPPDASTYDGHRNRNRDALSLLRRIWVVTLIQQK